MKATAYFLGGIRRFFVVVGADTLWQSHRDVKLLIVLRMVRLLGHGGTTLILAIYLHGLGFRDSDVGLFMTLTLIGDLVISSVLVYVGDAVGVRLTAIAGSILMCVAGVAFAYVSNFWLLLLAAILGVINPREVISRTMAPLISRIFQLTRTQCQRDRPLQAHRGVSHLTSQHRRDLQ